MYTKQEAKEHIAELAENFGSKLDFIKTSGQYKEAQIEDEFIKPLFKYLNWNISNEGIANSSEREFIVQAQGRNGKEPDYLLQLDGKRCFYIEAKHSKYDLKKRTDYIWQAYSYSYSTQSRPKYEKVDFALLTDFEEFRFFDCTFPVKNHETLNNYCVIDWKYTDYIDKFDLLWDTFEKNNVRNGSLEKLYINEKKIKENRIPPDKAFLNDLDNENYGWRISLAKDIKKIQPELSSEFITQSVQLILDRFIFIKVLSDREIEDDIIKQIVSRVQKEESSARSVFEECKDIFHDLDKTYNGSIFSRRTELDEVKVSNKTLFTILKDFLPENSRYNFKVISVEILGTIYEQFLGKVVTTTDKRAKIEYKPEVRKAGGVYYTPDYIVNYIVEKTVGEKLKECKTIEDLLEIKICDPACGSGSFLIAAYDALIQWTIEYISATVKTHSNASLRKYKHLYYTDSNGDIRLTSKIKRDILRSCIYGVDIDAQAVEVTKMSLSLKALENTTHYEVHNEVTLFHICVLPPLEGNIVQGNSLIGLDIYDSDELNLNSKKKKDREERISNLHPFFWEKRYSSIFKKQGFDCIIGNPPYILIQDFFRDDDALEYFRSKYISASYKIDTYHLFIEKGFKLLNETGRMGYITPSNYLTNNGLKALRHFLIEKTKIAIINIISGKVFKGASVDTCLTILTKDKRAKSTMINSKLASDNVILLEDKKMIFNQKDFLQNEGYIFTNVSQEKLTSVETVEVGQMFYVKFGMQLRDRKKFINDVVLTKEGKGLTKDHKPCYTGKNISEYNLKYTDLYAYVNEVARSGGCWDMKYHNHKPKILIRQIGKYPICCIDRKGYHCLNTLFMLVPKNTMSPIFIEAVLGILNSKFIKYYWNRKFYDQRDTFPKIKGSYIEKLILPKELFEKKNYAVSLSDSVNEIIDLYNKLGREKLESSKVSIKEKIDFLKDKVDSLVYKLYDLTSEEIRIVEGK